MTTELPTYTAGSKANWSLIPDYMIGGLRRYIENGIEPASFLFAVVSNNLRRAFECADGTNVHHIRNYLEFLYSYAPAECWGSPAKVEAWIKQGGLGTKEIA